MPNAARLLIAVIAALALVGVALLVFTEGIDGLPGNIVVRSGDTAYKLPIGLMVLVSILLTIVINIRRRR